MLSQRFVLALHKMYRTRGKKLCFARPKVKGTRTKRKAGRMHRTKCPEKTRDKKKGYEAAKNSKKKI